MRHIILFTLLTPLSLWATEVTLSGEGSVLSKPDYVEWRFHIHSKCYATPEQAATANDTAASSVVKYLNEVIQNNGAYNKVIANGGYTAPFAFRQGQCDRTFQKSHHIVVRTTQVDAFPKLFNEIQTKVNAELASDPLNRFQSPITYATFGAPNALLTEAKQLELEQQALQLALTHAKNKLGALFSADQVKDAKLKEVSEKNANRPQPMMRAMAHESASAPVQFDDSTVSTLLWFTFKID